MLVGCCLTTGASAAGAHAGTRTNQRFHSLASGRVKPEREAVPARAFGCMRGLGSASGGSFI
jgi:hypothetical protein